MQETINMELKMWGFETCEKIEVRRSRGFATTNRGQFAKTGYEITVTGDMGKFGKGENVTIASGFYTESDAKKWLKRKGLAA